MATSPWLGIKWGALGLFALLVGAVWFLAAVRIFNLWMFANHYVPAELEVQRFQPRAADRGKGRFIDGVIHPGGEAVMTSDTYLSIRRFVDPNDTTGRRVPFREEIEGQRLPVLYWPGHDAVQRWWHPPTVVMPGATQKGGAALFNALAGGAFFGVGLLCVRRGFRYLQACRPPELRQEEKP